MFLTLLDFCQLRRFPLNTCRKENIHLKDAHKFDLEQHCFVAQLPDLPGLERAYHSGTLSDSKVWVIGGSNGNNIHADVHVLDSSTQQWRTVEFG